MAAVWMASPSSRGGPGAVASTMSVSRCPEARTYWSCLSGGFDRVDMGDQDGARREMGETGREASTTGVGL